MEAAEVCGCVVADEPAEGGGFVCGPEVGFFVVPGGEEVVAKGTPSYIEYWTCVCFVDHDLLH